MMRRIRTLTISERAMAATSWTPGPRSPPAATPVATLAPTSVTPEDGQQQEPASASLQAARLLHARHVPDLRKRPPERQGHSEPGPQRPREPDRERDAAAFQRMDLVAQLIAGHRDAGEGGVQDVVAE